jgi:hypothetical protein
VTLLALALLTAPALAAPAPQDVWRPYECVSDAGCPEACDDDCPCQCVSDRDCSEACGGDEKTLAGLCVPGYRCGWFCVCL